MRKAAFLCLNSAIILFAALFSAAAFAEDDAPLSCDDFASMLKAAVETREMNGAVVSAAVSEVKQSRAILKIADGEPMMPASNQKAVVTAAALELLGRDYTFRTKVFATGPIGGGELRGHLVVVGSGDPNISGRLHNDDPCAIFKSWAAALKEMGVRRIRGDIVGDDSLFDRNFIHSSWPKNQLNLWYCAPSGALALNDGCLDINVTPGRGEGSPASFTVSPQTDYLKITNACTTVSSGKPGVGAVRAEGSRESKLIGKCRAGTGTQKINLTVDNPGLYFVTVLKEELVRQGIAVDGSARLIAQGENLPHDVLVAEHVSTLPMTAAIANKHSQNFYADMLLKLVGAQNGGKGGWETGAKAVGDFLVKIGVPKTEFNIVDGSGLSRDNRISAGAIVKVLERMFNSKLCHAFWQSLSVAGIDGTLDDRFKSNPAARGRVAAKSGYIAGVCTLSGYAATPKGRYFAFSILVNDVEKVKNGVSAVQQAQENLVNILINHGDRLK
jgi:D-alanyl-D-alanine carboxypeptidase/D-alanyl-D-alanine-endopeptidase (penicillin-binding protein 4)